MQTSTVFYAQSIIPEKIHLPHPCHSTQSAFAIQIDKSLHNRQIFYLVNKNQILKKNLLKLVLKFQNCGGKIRFAPHEHVLVCEMQCKVCRCLNTSKIFETGVQVFEKS